MTLSYRLGQFIGAVNDRQSIGSRSWKPIDRMATRLRMRSNLHYSLGWTAVCGRCGAVFYQKDGHSCDG